jgi:hypothetical protein
VFLQPLVAPACKLTITGQVPTGMGLGDVPELLARHVGFVEWDSHSFDFGAHLTHFEHPRNDIRSVRERQHQGAHIRLRLHLTEHQQPVLPYVSGSWQSGNLSLASRQITCNVEPKTHPRIGKRTQSARVASFIGFQCDKIRP